MTRDRLIAAALLLAAWGEQLTGGREDPAAHLAVAALMCGPIALAARWPWLPAAACAAGMVVYGAIGTEPDSTGEIFALAAAAFLAGSRMSLRGGALTIAATAVAGAVHLALLGGLADIVFIAGIFLVPPFLLGRAVRSRRERIRELESLNAELTAERERSAELAAELERARITRDLEAVVAAGLDAMIEEARRGEALVERDGAAAAAAFEAIRRDGAEATAELRRLLHLLQG